ncbi:MAG: VOC family protein [Winogradskyella sp.]|nr:VOC family protein [Winogradskyella sp.]NNK40621.1 VOC family protein [Winogradskyella sp.]
MVVWFEIPVDDMDRAKAFYDKVFSVNVEIMNFGGLLMGMFPNKGPEYGATGTLIKQDTYIPSKEGTLVYFRCEDVANELDRVEAAGGQIYQPKTKISDEHGFMAAFIDTKVNRIALHSRQ